MADNTVGASGFQLSGTGPARYEQFVAPLMKPFIKSLIDSTVRTGDAVLDVACGTGFATRAAIAAVGPTGTVAALDVNAGMLDEARSRCETPVDWREASALTLPFADASFDSVICQQGVQFFPDPVAGLAEMRRVLRPGGRVGVTVWAPVQRSPYLSAQIRVLGGALGVGASAGSVPCPPGGEDALLGWAVGAGWTNPHVVALEHVVDLANFESYVPNHLGALPWSGPFFALPADVQRTALASILDELARYIDAAGDAHIPTTSLLLTCAKQVT
jgi:SAM-dependent methyltransferase